MQLGFDFYDSSNDNQISELDMFKVVHYYGRDGGKETASRVQMFQEYIQEDIMAMMAVVKHFKSKP
jgi:hypothetical protein